jgi:hypothetical protein
MHGKTQVQERAKAGSKKGRKQRALFSSKNLLILTFGQNFKGIASQEKPSLLLLSLP